MKNLVASASIHTATKILVASTRSENKKQTEAEWHDPVSFTFLGTQESCRVTFSPISSPLQI